VFGHGRLVAELLLTRVTLITGNCQRHVPGPVRLDVHGQRWSIRPAAYGTHGLVVLQTVGHRIAVERPVARLALYRASERVRQRLFLAPVVERDGPG